VHRNAVPRSRGIPEYDASADGSGTIGTGGGGAAMDESMDGSMDESMDESMDRSHRCPALLQAFPVRQCAWCTWDAPSQRSLRYR